MLQWHKAVAAGLLLAMGSVVGMAQAGGQEGAATAAPAASTPAVPVQDQPTKEQLMKLFDEMRIKAQLDTMMKSMTTVMRQQLKQQIKAASDQLPEGKSLTPAQQDAVEALTRKYMDEAIHMMPVSEMLDDMVDLYQHHLSKQDVDAMIAFYGSPAGQHLLDAQPAIMQEYMPKIMARVGERSKEMTQQMMHDFKDLMAQQDSKPDDSKKN